MDRVAYALMQDRLSTVGSFILCDGMADGFPIRYASRGFVDLFGYNAAECLNKSCGALVAGATITASDVEGVSQQHGLTETTVREAMKVHTSQVIEECKNIMADKGEHVGFSLVLNRTKRGHLFVCEVLMLAMEHPVVGWPYTIGLQRDVSEEVSVKELLEATTPEMLDVLIRRQEGPVKERIAGLQLNSADTNEYFNSKSMDMWEDMMRMVLAAKGDLKVQDLSSGSVTLSTADGLSQEDEASSGYDTASSQGDALPVCLHVRGLSSSTTRDQLGAMFQPFGHVLSVEVEPSREPGAACLGFVVVATAEAAVRAVTELAGKTRDGGELGVAVGAIAGTPAAPQGFSVAKATAALSSGSAWSSIQRLERSLNLRSAAPQLARST